MSTEVERLKKQIVELELLVEKLKWEKYDIQWSEICEFFNENGIRQTATKFNMSIKDVMDFIVKCDNNTDGLQSASDYRECHILAYGEDPYYDSGDNDDNSTA